MNPPRRIAGALASTALLLSACGSKPVHPPEQWHYDPFALAVAKQTLRFDQPGSEKYIIDGVTQGDPNSAFSWISPRANLRFWLKPGVDARIKVVYSVAQATFQKTGPVTVTIAVNDEILNEMRCTAARVYEQFATVPDRVGAKAYPATVSLTVNPPYTAGDDGEPLGVLLKEVTIEN